MLDFIINILATPSILVGLMSMVGLILQGKAFEDVIKGTVKTIVGFLVLSAGAGFLQTGSLNAFWLLSVQVWLHWLLLHQLYCPLWRQRRHRLMLQSKNQSRQRKTNKMQRLSIKQF